MRTFYYNKLKEFFSKNELETYLEDLDCQAIISLYEKTILGHDKKNLGQFFTPEFIIKYMLDQVDIKSNNFKVLDPACGPGSFLLEVFDRLRKELVDRGFQPNEIGNIILRLIRGFEIDETTAKLAEILLFINAGVKPDTNARPIMMTNFLEESTKETYDLIIGNPPYYLISSNRRFNKRGKQFHTTFFEKETIDRYKNVFRSWPHNNRNVNISYLFVEQGILLLKEGGKLVFILPDIILAGQSTVNLRKVILDYCKIEKIILIEGKVFRRGGISNIILVLEKCMNKDKRYNHNIKVVQTSVRELENPTEINRIHKLPQRIFYTNPFNVFSVKMTRETLKKFENVYARLNSRDLIRLGEIVEITRGIENLKKNQSVNSSDKLDKAKKLISSSNVSKYRVLWEKGSFSRRYVEYDPIKYRNVKFKEEGWFTRPKIVLRRIERKLICAFDEEQYFALDSVQLLWLKEEYKDRYSLRLLVALLNSDFLNLYYQTLFSYKQLFAKVQKVYLENLPIPKNIDPRLQRKISRLVKKLELKYSNKVDLELNNIVNSLYFD